jgi:ubiquitin-protein ligase
MAESRLNKTLYTEITRLKLLDTDTAESRFRLQKSPFNDDESDNQEKEGYVVVGQIFPKSNIYNERSYSIEIKLKKTFPFEPPEVRFLTPIYHPNIDKDGRP